MKSGDTLFLRLSAFLKVAMFAILIAIFFALLWGFFTHDLKLPQPLIVAFWIIVPARILVWLGWRHLRERNAE